MSHQQDDSLMDEPRSVDLQFAKVLETQLSKLRSCEGASIDDSSLQHSHPALEIVQQFGEITSQRALEVKSQEIYNGTSSQEEFDNWDLETKLWRLVEELYSIRLYPFENDGEYEELKTILHWLQDNSPLVTTPEDDDLYNKWSNTRISLSTSKLNPSAEENTDKELVEYLDADAPLRSNKRVDLADEKIDSVNFETIYKFVLLGQIESAIDYAKDTGNLTIALILTGALDDSDKMTDDNKKSGNFKSTWIKVLYKLSQKDQLNRFERLIYAYLSGGDISENLEYASSSYEEYLNVLIQQLLANRILVNEKSTSLEDIQIPPPQAKSVGEILNMVSGANGTKAEEESRHPIRVISASVMINTIGSLIQTVNENTDDKTFRILTHLAIFLALVKPLEDGSQLRDLITMYVSKLSKSDQPELIPLYLSFIQNEGEAREIYSLILSSINDKQERAKHLQVARRNVSGADDDVVMVSDDTAKEKLDNVLKMVVSNVMVDTESHYEKGNGTIVISDEDLEDAISEDDKKLCHAVEWLYDNRMFEDAIRATIVVIRRFLKNGKLTSLKSFAEGKNFKNLVSDYNLQNTGAEYDAISEDTKLELINYENFVEGLRLLGQWRKFTADNNTYDGSTVEASLNKTTKLINKLVLDWHKELNDPELIEFRKSYVPYLIMELLTIYENAREKDWKYIRLAFELVHLVADDGANDLLECFNSSGKLKEFLNRIGQLSATATERGLDGLYCL